MAKEVIYESAVPTRGITTNRDMMQFQPPKDGDSFEGMPYGELNIANKRIQDVHGMSEADLRKLVESHDDYTEDPALVGKRGIWPKNLRLSSIRKAEAERNRRDAFEGLDDAALEAIIKSKGGKAPKNSEHQTLVDLCVKLHTVSKEEPETPAVEGAAAN
mgnify:FL=1